MTQEALKLALEALEANDQLINGTGTKGGLVYCMDGYYSGCFDVDPINKQTEEAITAIKEALAQRTEQNFCSRCGKRTKDIHTCTPPQRSESSGKPSAWVGLTDEDRQAAFESMPDMLDGFLKTWGWLHFSKAIEAKLKEKNT
jgi:hypothetical protein